MEAFPAFFPLRGARVVIAGDGGAAEAKARLFQGSPAEVTRLTGETAASPASYQGAALAFVAIAELDLRRAAAAAARAAHVPVNVVDDSMLSDFHTPAVIDRGQVVVAIGTAGAAPFLASLLRTDIEARIPEGIGRIAALLGAERERVNSVFPEMALRRAFLRSVLAGPAADAAAADDMDLAARLLAEAIAAGFTPEGRVVFVRGVERPDLICLRAMRALAEADVVVSDPADTAFVDRHARRDAERLSPKAANADALANLAQAGRLAAVVCRNGGAGNAQALTALGVAVEVLRPAPAP